MTADMCYTQSTVFALLDWQLMLGCWIRPANQMLEQTKYQTRPRTAILRTRTKSPVMLQLMPRRRSLQLS
jgi:hypothetical protein